MPGTPDPSIPTPVPIVQPETATAVAEALRDASSRRQSVVIRGAGTKMDWGRPAGRIDAILDMSRMNRVVAHQHGDLTATFEAGAPLSAVNAALAQHAQWLPFDPAFADRATIGGLLATNDSGPLRHCYGTPRDLVIGVQLATVDGTLAKAGGQVVKNVAGYDLGRLVTGSFGSLAAIVTATFKLSPLPAASKTLIVAVDTDEGLGQLVRKMMASQLEPIAFEIHVRADERSTQRPQSTQSDAGTISNSANSASSAFNRRVVLRFASLPVVVDAQIAQARALLGSGAPSVEVIEGDVEGAWWREHNARLWSLPGAIVRASWLPASIVAKLAELHALGTPAELVGRAAVGAGLLRVDGDAESQSHAITRLRRSSTFGNVVILRGSGELKTRVDVWGSSGDREPLFAAIKRALDPRNTLNAGRGPL